MYVLNNLVNILWLIVLVGITAMLLMGCSSSQNDTLQNSSGETAQVSSEDAAQTQTEVYTSKTKADPDVLKVMSWNCLTTTKAGSDYIAGKKGYYRWEILRDTLKDEMPDSIGIQEITEEWLNCIRDNILADTFAIAGLTSDSGSKLAAGSGESNPILYRCDLYSPIAEGGFWLSETPDVPSRYETMKFNRVAAYVVLAGKVTGEPVYIHVNTHLDHKSTDEVNVSCAGVLAEHVAALCEKYSCTAFITGDFNANEKTAAYKYLADGGAGISDAKYLTEDHSDSGSCPGYWQDFSLASDTDPIDHIFVCGSAEIIRHTIIPNKYFSDHSAVLVESSLQSLQAQDHD